MRKDEIAATRGEVAALSRISDGGWHSIPSLVKAAGLSTLSGGAFGTMYSRLKIKGWADVRYDDSGYWTVSEYRITNAGRDTLNQPAEGSE